VITPSRKEFAELAEKGNLIPVSSHVVADMETPVSAYMKMTRRSDGTTAPHSFLLESVEGGENVARYSFIGVDPLAVFTHSHGKGILEFPDGTSEEIPGSDVFEKTGNVLKRYRHAEPPGDRPPFTGGAVGYASYDVVSEFEDTVPRPGNAPVDVPDSFFMVTGSLLVFDRVLHTIEIIVQANVASPAAADAAYDRAAAEIAKIEKRLSEPLPRPPIELSSTVEPLRFESNKTESEFKEMVETAKKHIYDGDIIQVVLSQRFSAEVAASPVSVYRALRTLNPSPYMFLLRCGGFDLVGASPEVHAKSVDGVITVRPIAGTRKRGKNAAEDAALADELLADPKERAEHVMLVDLGRNDVGRVAETGSVEVGELMVIEKYSHVMHIVSNVTGRLSEGFDADAVLRSTFPAGTLSGAPKVRAMKIISDLEREERGPYGGAVAYLSFDGNLDSCITIRTALLKDGKAYVQAGAGIVADSVPELEYQETVNKAKAMMKALAMASKFE
jgi:anthranilate synthase component 1